MEKGIERKKQKTSKQKIDLSERSVVHKNTFENQFETLRLGAEKQLKRQTRHRMTKIRKSRPNYLVIINSVKIFSP